MSEPLDIPIAVWEGTFRLLGVTLKCAVLNDGRRIIDADSFACFMAALEDPNGEAIDSAEMTRFAQWRTGVSDV